MLTQPISLADLKVAAGQLNIPGVYFVTGGALVKIGFVQRTYSGGVGVRLGNMRSGSPVPLNLHRFIRYGHAMGLERLLHARYATLRHHGEWFSQELLAEIDAMTDEEIISLMPHRRRRTPSGLQTDSVLGQH